MKNTELTRMKVSFYFSAAATLVLGVFFTPSGDRIVAIGRIDGSASRTIDASGLYVAPGFIDMHSHSETFRLLNGGHGPSFAFQGFTTEIYGETESMGPLGGKRRFRL